MKASELYDEFLKCCKEYDIEYGNIVLKNEENIFILFKPNNNENSITYQIRIGSSRESGYAYDINKLISLVTTTVGSDKLTTPVDDEKSKVKKIEYNTNFYGY